MSTYAQWRAAVDRGELRRVTWVCGDQRILVEEVVDTIRDRVKAHEASFIGLSVASASAAKEVWATLAQYPMHVGTNRLVVVRGADKLGNFEPLTAWLGRLRELAGVYAVFVSDEHEFTTVKTADKPKLAPHLEAIRDKPRIGAIVRCGSPNEPDAVTWVRRRADNFDDETARHLLLRTGGNLAAASAVCAKLKIFPGNPSPSIVDKLAAEAPADSFVDCLLAHRKPDALRALDGMHERDYLPTVTQLGHKLDTMAVLWRANRAGTTLKDIRGVPPFVARKYLPHARHYDPQRCVYSRKLLAVIDEALRNGARTAVLESLVALW